MEQDNRPENYNESQNYTETEDAAETAVAEEAVEASETETVAEDPRTREELLAEVAKLTAEADDYKSRYLRAQADFDNFRRRSRQEKEEFAAYANQKIVEDLLPVLDTFEMALKTPETADVKTLLTGVDMVFRQLQSVLSNQGLQAIEAVGQPFDPNLHEGIMQVDATEEHPSNTVVEELRKGYRIKEKVVRPSMVKVSK